PASQSLALLVLITVASALREDAMLYRDSVGAIVLTAALCATIAGAQAWDESKYPDLTGQWVRAEGARGVGRYDPTKPPARGQEAPLTAEYQAIYAPTPPTQPQCSL